MSYILEALKKAESERRLGAIPDVHAQSLPMAGPEENGWPRRLPAWVAAGLSGLLALGMLAWYRPWQAEPPPAASLPAAPALAAVPPAPLAPPLPQAMPAAPPKPAVKMEKSPERLPAARPAPAAGSNADPARKEPSKPVQERKAAAPAVGKPEALASAGGTKEAAAPALPAWQDLPENMRRNIPALAINGYIYAGNPADRSIIINGRLLHEGEQVLPGLTLERMLPREAVMNYQGQRYRLAY